MVFQILSRRRAPPVRDERYLTVDGRELPVTVRENDRATRLTLRIAPGGQSLRVTTPPHVLDGDVDDFIARNRNWVAARLSRLPQTVRAAPGTVIPLLGEDHLIVPTGRLRGVVEPAIEEDRPILRVPGDENAVGRKLLAFMKGRARLELDRAVSGHAAALGVRPRAMRITDTTSRWGSCSTSRTLSFSWRIVMAPPDVLGYLAAHEVAHLREMNHGPAFWALVDQLCPEASRLKGWLRHNGARLHAIDLS